MKKSGFNAQEIELIINHAFQEDIGNGDITTNNIVPENKLASASMTAKADGIIAGIDIAEMVFRKLDENLEWNPKIKDGDSVKKGDVILEIKGTFRALLTGERLALNLMQRMSGIATETAKYVAETKGSKVKILDTRKTVPGLRTFDKYAVKMGGGTNHRIGLYDMVMIKDNHIKMAGTITAAVEQVRKSIPSEIKVEVETTNLQEVEEAVNAGADIIMLDNMSNELMCEAVDLINGKALIEASGNMNLERISGVAKTGVDFISVGALTHSVIALDISQNIII
ncbi:carboxylating nicotinate-nucleotide diphosphorylase [Labilibaculum sp. DW002]|jgi:nicotinate-nucleotide pyrophosphorylase (carboxylating)|uniref:nicotinate-nucleotide diphosphorylase (carboxylating) n=1 Tax=Paralabilibaculum antarcticum TaxID=2912572 RepID=A0ABT5VTT0_9BACT|nr:MULTISPECIES: carboxylating nicotinate-nucleotide diphosphorylase [unclassified Labilibaculum]MBI9057054.1 carboxylating nicotinate-nucleotide diphosphorylase [Labilibaculum sp.]MDE5417689.1 carboxylating nicotinate-nucleotide diphosphorylase [Labilibaculum sp. DW002]